MWKSWWKKGTRENDPLTIHTFVFAAELSEDARRQKWHDVTPPLCKTKSFLE